FDVELRVVGDRKDAERNVARSLFFDSVLLAEERPAAIARSKEKWTRMPGVAKREPSGGCEKGGDNRGGERAIARERGELLIEQADEFFLVEPVDKAAHQRAQVGCRGSH